MELNKKFIKRETRERILELLPLWEVKEKFLDPKYNIGRFARDMGYNYKYLSTILNKEYGMDFPTYINTLRVKFMVDTIGEAKSIHNLNITKLARASGFSSYFKLVHFLKKNRGVGPKDFFLKNPG